MAGPTFWNSPVNTRTAQSIEDFKTILHWLFFFMRNRACHFIFVVLHIVFLFDIVFHACTLLWSSEVVLNVLYL